MSGDILLEQPAAGYVVAARAEMESVNWSQAQIATVQLSECELLLDGDLALHPKCVVEEDGAREVVRPFPDRYEQ